MPWTGAGRKGRPREVWHWPTRSRRRDPRMHGASCAHTAPLVRALPFCEWGRAGPLQAASLIDPREPAHLQISWARVSIVRPLPYPGKDSPICRSSQSLVARHFRGLDQPDPSEPSALLIRGLFSCLGRRTRATSREPQRSIYSAPIMKLWNTAISAPGPDALF